MQDGKFLGASCTLLSHGQTQLTTARNLDGENLNFKGYEKKKWTHPRFLHRGPKKAVEQDSDVHFDLT